MRLDQYNVLIIEKDGPPGDLGDSCAETGRYTVLSEFTQYFPYGRQLSLDRFIGRNDGFIRHPDVPEDWKEKDFTSDQGINLLMGYDVNGIAGAFNYCAQRMKLFTSKYNKVSSPGVFAVATRRLTLLRWLNWAQGLAFKLPLRWSDAKGWFDKSHDSSADYLNWIVVCAYLKSKGREPILNVDRTVLEEKVRSYHANQQNVALIIALYMAASKKLYERV